MTQTKTSLTARDNPRSASELDRQIGSRLKLARKLARMSQSDLANAVGVTFQQIQKYERGANRVPASRLYEFGQILGQPVSYFFEGSEPGEASSRPALSNLEAKTADEVLRALDRCPPEVRGKLMETILSAGERESSD